MTSPSLPELPPLPGAVAAAGALRDAPTPTPRGLPASSPTPLDSLLADLGQCGVRHHQFECLGAVYRVRTLSVDDEVYCFDRAVTDAASEMGRLAVLRVYLAALMVEGVVAAAPPPVAPTDLAVPSLDLALFGRLVSPLEWTGELRAKKVNALAQVFGKAWDKRVFRLFFRYLWAWAETSGKDFVRGVGVEAFLAPDELALYRDLKLAEEVEARAAPVLAALAADRQLAAVDDLTARASLDVGDLES